MVGLVLSAVPVITAAATQIARVGPTLSIQTVVVLGRALSALEAAAK